MPKLEGIISSFDTLLKAKELKAEGFQRGKFYGIVTRLTNSEGNYIFSDDNGNPVTIDDKFPFQLFYICTQSADNPRNPDPVTSDTIYSMTAFVYYDKRKISVSKFDLNHMIRRMLQENLKPSNVTDSGVSSVRFNYLSSNYDSSQIAQQNFSKDKKLDVNNILFTISFTVIVTAMKGCELCVTCN